MSKIQDELIELLNRFITIPSVNPPGNEAPVAQLLSEVLESAGLDILKVPVTEERVNILARLPGRNSDEGIIFTGHMDVVPVSDEELPKWETPPFTPTRKGAYIYGRGSADMKSGLAAAATALIWMKNNSIVPERDIVLAATVDEEDFMSGSKAVTAHPLLEKCRSVVVCEPTSMQLCTKGKGRTYGEVIIQGNTGHGSTYSPDSNGILIANQFISEMQKTDFSPWAHETYGTSFWQPLAIEAGVEPGLTPDKCTIKFDARLVPGHMPDTVWTEMDKIIKRFSNYRIESRVIDKREPYQTDENSFIVKTAKQILEQHNKDSASNIFPGTTDGTMFRRNNRDIIIIGPGSLNCAHKANERVSVTELEEAFLFYRDLMNWGC